MVSPDVSDFRKEAERKLNAVEKALKVTINSALSMKGAKVDLLQGVRQMRALAKAHPVQTQTGVDAASMHKTSQEVEQWRKRLSPVRIEAKVDSNGLRKMLRGLANLGASAAKFAAVGAAIGGIATLALSAGSNLAALSASLASLAGLLPVLPGLLGGLAIGLGVSFAALKDFGSIFPDVAASLSKMQDAISARFWEQVQAPIRHLIDTLLPQLSAGFQATATALGGYFGNLAASFTGAFDGALAGIFADLASSIAIATTGTGALAGIVRTLGEVGAGYLPRLAQWFVDITTQFDTFLAKASADGRLVQWIENGITALRDLGSVLGGLGGILYGIGTAAVAAGGSVLGTLGTALQRVSDVVNSEPFQTGLTAVFAAAHEALDRIATLSGPGVTAFFQSLTTLLPTLLPIIGDALGTALGAVAEALSSVAVQTAVVTLFEALREAVELLAPVLTGLTGFLSQHTTVAKVLAIAIGTTVVAAYAALAISSAVTTTKVVASNLAIAGSAAATAAKTVASWAKMTASFVAGTASLVAAVATIVATYVKLAAKAALNAAKVVASWVAMAAGAVASAAVHVAQVGVMVAKWAFLGVQSLAHAAKVAAAWLIAMGPIGLVIAAVVAVVALIIANFDTIKRVTVELWEKVKAVTSQAWEQVKAVVGTAVAFITGLFLNFTVPGLVVQHWDSIKRTFSSGVEAVKGYVRGLPGEIAGFFSNAGSLLVNAGRAIIDGLLSGITSSFGKVRAKLGELTSMLPDWKGPAPRDRVLLFDAGQLIIEGLLNGMESQYDGVKKSLTGLTKDIGSTVIDSPTMADIASPQGGVARGLALGVASATEDGGATKVFNYYAAPGSSLSSEEELFAAAGRSRMIGW
jgi:hypothetical protein